MFYYFQDNQKLLEGNLEFKEHKYMFNSYEMELYSVHPVKFMYTHALGEPCGGRPLRPK